MVKDSESQEISSYLVEFNKAIDQAILEGFTVVRGNSRTLLLDLDSPSDKAQFERTIGPLNGFVDLTVSERWESKSGIGEHVVLTADRDLSATERIVLQMALGSDRIHEMLSLVTGIWEGNEEPTVLFKPPVKALEAAK